ncbi:LPXTG cell wall anchor domain-containing protein [Paenibacillus sp. BR2-3]|uniref:LPXTG cell wall anchor domain-containing protein n=1 Tax=Paenibacillus sp. BR2-3 TaxID=3048494 RepID=UPI003977B3D3
MKKILALMLIMLLTLSTYGMVFAGEAVNNHPLNIEILSPTSVKDYPGLEQTIKAKITNNSNVPTGELLAYITMADIRKNMTVNLEDYSADKPVVIDGLKANESRTVDLPVRFVYTSNYKLYVTVAYKESNIINSSLSIPIEILGNTKIDKTMVVAVSGIEPLLLLGVVGFIFLKRRRKFKIS